MGGPLVSFQAASRPKQVRQFFAASKVRLRLSRRLRPHTPACSTLAEPKGRPIWLDP